MLRESGLILSGYCHSETGLVHESSFDKAIFSSLAALCPLRPAGLINIKMITAHTNLPDRAPILIYVLLKRKKYTPKLESFLKHVIHLTKTAFVRNYYLFLLLLKISKLV